MRNTLIKSISAFLVIAFSISLSWAQKSSTDSTDATAYNKRGLAFIEKNQYDQAILEFDKALEINPKFVEAYRNRGVARRVKRQHEQALMDLNKTLEINPRFAEAYVDRGICYYYLYQDDQAIMDFNRALELNPQLAQAYASRGIVYLKSDLNKAISDFNKALKIDPGHSVAYYNRLAAYYLKKEYHKCWKEVNRAKNLGYEIPAYFIDYLREASGRSG